MPVPRSARSHTAHGATSEDAGGGSTCSCQTGAAQSGPRSLRHSRVPGCMGLGGGFGLRSCTRCSFFRLSRLRLSR
eukprot:1801325-Prymnesium_polylepis.1